MGSGLDLEMGDKGDRGSLPGEGGREGAISAIRLRREGISGVDQYGQRQ